MLIDNMLSTKFYETPPNLRIEDNVEKLYERNLNNLLNEVNSTFTSREVWREPNSWSNYGLRSGTQLSYKQSKIDYKRMEKQ